MDLLRVSESASERGCVAHTSWVGAGRRNQKDFVQVSDGHCSHRRRLWHGLHKARLIVRGDFIAFDFSLHSLRILNVLRHSVAMGNLCPEAKDKW
jgi:hypothetical protein